MVLLIPAHSVMNGNGKSVALDVPNSKVPKYLARGWQLAEGEEYTPEVQKGKRVLEVDPSIVESVSGGRAADPIGVTVSAPEVENTSTGEDTNKSGEDEDDDESATGDAATETSGPQRSLSGLAKEALLTIAEAEGVEVNPDANKIVIKSAIEAARSAKASE